MKNLKAILSLQLALLWSLSVLGQKSTANASYTQLSYQEAIGKYQKTLQRDENDGEAMFNLANSYRLNGEYSLAEQWFAQAVEVDGRPLARLYYGQTAMTNGKYEQAKKQFLLYSTLASHSSDQETARALAKKCDEYAAQGIPNGPYTVDPVPFNTEELDFSPAYFNDSALAFVSNRPESESERGSRDPWTHQQFMDIYEVPYGDHDNTFQAPRQIEGKLNGNFHEGPMVFADGGKTIFFTRNDYERRRRYDDQDNTRLKIFQGMLEEGEWVIDQEMPFNDSEYSTAHPALSADGKWMVFASDRPGGYGQMDLYMVRKHAEGWGKPFNLGPEINSSGNEVFPFLDENEQLFFSSDFKVGIGGLDIYSSKRKNGEWQPVVNLGAPINSPRDDFGFIAQDGGQKGYFSSNRSGKDDDIYFFKAQEGEPIRGRVVLCNTNQPIPAVDVEVSGQNFQTLQLISDEDGIFSFSAPLGKTLEAVANGSGYVTTEGCPGKETFVAETDVELVLALVGPPDPNAPLPRMITGKVSNAHYGTPLPKTKIKLINRCTGEVYETTTDANGFYQVPAPEDCDYILQTDRPNFKPVVLPVSTFDTDPHAPVAQDIPLVFDEGSIPGLLPSGTPLTSGLLIELEHIYFDYDKYYIRPDALPELTELLMLLRKYPDVKGEIRAHTDARAPYAYNITLSRNRAKAAYNWLVMNGIDASRLSYRGYGETVPRNRCYDGINCSEDEHQRNRRVEFYIQSSDGKSEVSKENPRYR